MTAKGTARSGQQWRQSALPEAAGNGGKGTQPAKTGRGLAVAGEEAQAAGGGIEGDGAATGGDKEGFACVNGGVVY